MPKLIIDGIEHPDQWLHLNDQDTLPNNDFSVCVTRWAVERDAIITQVERTASALGVRLAVATDPMVLASDIERFSLIVIDIEDPADGRFFSIATRLREHLNYTREIRVTGRVAPDQLVFMQRSGINAFALDEHINFGNFLSRYQRFYQSSTQTGQGDEQIRHARRQTPQNIQRPYNAGKPLDVLVDGVIQQDNLREKDK